MRTTEATEKRINYEGKRLEKIKHPRVLKTFTKQQAEEKKSLLTES